MDDLWAKWRPAALVLGGTVLAVGLIAFFFGRGGPSPSPAPPSPSETSAPAVTAPPPLPPPPPPVPTPTPTPTPTKAPVTTASPPPPEPEPAPTSEWQTIDGLQARADRLLLEIKQLDKDGKTDESAAKKIELRKVGVQLAELRRHLDAGAAAANSP